MFHTKENEFENVGKNVAISPDPNVLIYYLRKLANHDQ